MDASSALVRLGLFTAAACVTSVLAVRKHHLPSASTSSSTDADGPPVSLSPSELKSRLTTLCSEYLFSLDESEAVSLLTRLPAGADWGVELVKRAVYVCYDRRAPRVCEILAHLLSHLNLIGLLRIEHVNEGLAAMLARLTDSALDTPNAADLLADFISTLLVEETQVEVEMGGVVKDAVQARIAGEIPHPLAQVAVMYDDILAAYCEGEVHEWDDLNLLAARIASLDARHTGATLATRLIHACVRHGVRGRSLTRQLKSAGVLSQQALDAAWMRLLNAGAGDADQMGAALAAGVKDGVVSPSLLHFKSRGGSTSTAVVEAAAAAASPARSPSLRAQRSSDGTWIATRPEPQQGKEVRVETGAILCAAVAALESDAIPPLPSSDGMRELVDAILHAVSNAPISTSTVHTISSCMASLTPRAQRRILFCALQELCSRPPSSAALFSALVGSLLTVGVVTPAHLVDAAAGLLQAAVSDEAALPVASVTPTLLAVFMPAVHGGWMSHEVYEPALGAIAGSNEGAATVLRRLQRVQPSSSSGEERHAVAAASQGEE